MHLLTQLHVENLWNEILLWGNFINCCRHIPTWVQVMTSFLYCRNFGPRSERLVERKAVNCIVLKNDVHQSSLFIDFIKFIHPSLWFSIQTLLLISGGTKDRFIFKCLTYRCTKRMHLGYHNRVHIRRNPLWINFLFFAAFGNAKTYRNDNSSRFVSTILCLYNLKY